MNWSVKLAKSLIRDKTHQRHYFIQIICQIAIALCLSTVLLSSFLIRGFESKIQEKIFYFWSHIRISSIGNSIQALGDKPIQLDIKNLSSSRITKITPVANKGVILKFHDNIEGLILKGIPLGTMKDYQFSQQQSLPYNKTSEVPIIPSNSTLDRMNAKLGDIIFVNVLDSAPRTLKGKIINTYFTNIEEFDQQIALTDIQAIQEINQWKSDEYSWIELSLSSIDKIPEEANRLYQKLEDVNVETIQTIFPQLFDWLALMKRNEVIIFIVMIIVAIVNIISSMSIFIIEKTKLIGLLKVLGARNQSLYQMLYYQIGFILLRGILLGNAITILLGLFIDFFKPIRLNPSIYYVDYAPLKWDFSAWLGLNLLTIVVCFLSTWFPLLAISRISPVKVVEYN